MKRRSTRVYSLIMNCTAPVLTAVFLGGAVCWAAELQYEDTVKYHKPAAAAVMAENGLDTAIPLPLECKMPVYELALTDNANMGAELVEACGVYIGNEFVGAVTDGESVEKELDSILEDYRSNDDIIEADFAVEPEIKEGLYRTETLVREEDMTDFLSGEKKIVGEYTVEGEETAEKIAEDFGMSVDEVKKLNPDVAMEEKRIKDGEQVKVQETVSVLPVKYVREEQEEEIVQVDSLCYDEGHQLVPGGITGKKLSTYEVTYVDGSEVSRKLKNTETTEIQEGTDEEGETALFSESVPDTADLFSSNFIWPVNGGYVSDPFMSDRNHKGMDIAAPSGTDIYASDGGTVLEAGWNDGGYGNYVMIDHGNGYVTLYGHASEVFVSPGESVEQGQVIAAVGTTGDSTGNHCHFEVRYGGEYLDPADFV